nr:hypothetical protein [Tanacetum cinerariifolium]
NDDQPFPVIAQVSLAGNAQNAPSTLKDPKFWTAKEKKTRKIDHMRGCGYDEQDRKTTILYEYETFKANEGEHLLDTYLHYLQVINDLKQCGYKKVNCELNYKFLNNLKPEWKQYGTLIRQTKNLMDINIDALYNILKQNQGDVNDALGYKKKAVVITSDPLALVAEKTNAFNQKFYSKPTNNNLRTSSTSQSANKKQEFVKSDDKKEDKKADEKKRDMSKIKSKKDSDEQVLLAEDQALMESNSDFDQEINANMVFMAQIEKVLSESDESSLSAKETIVEINFEDDYFQKIINRDFDKIDSSFQQTSSLKSYVPNVILEKIIIDLEDEVMSLLEKDKVNLKTIESLKSKGFESSENVISESENQSENDCLEVEKECNKVENSKVITPGMFKLSKSQSVSPISMSITSYESKKFENLDTLSSVRRRKHSGVIWKKKGSSNTSNDDLSSVSHSKLNKNVKRYSRKDLLSCNNSHLGETSSAYVCNDAMNVSCNSRMCDLFDDNNFLIFDDESVRISPVRKMPFRKKPHDSMNVRSKSNSNNSLPRTVHKWLPKLQPLAEPVAKIYNKRTRKIHESVNVNFDEISEMASKQFSLKLGLSNLNKTGKSSNPLVSQVSEASNKDLEDLFHNFYDEYFDSSKIMKSSTTNVETSINEEVFHEVSESFQGKSSSSSLNDDVQHSPEEVILPQTNTQLISNNMIPNVDKASTSHNVFNERLEDAYFDASTSFHDPYNVHTFYQPYPHEKKWTKDHLLHKIIGDPKLSVRTRGQLANSCLFSYLLSSIEPANVAKALRDADWVSAMQEKLDQFAILKVWRLVPRPEGKTIIKTKWIFKNKKDKSSLVIRNKARLVAVGYSQQEGIDYE